MPQNPNSPKRPLLFALTMACASLLYSLGGRGGYCRYEPAVEIFGFWKTAKIFISVFLVVFVISYILRKLGISIDDRDK